MPETAQLLQLINHWLGQIGRCLSWQSPAHACRPFWNDLIYAAIAIGLAVAIWIAWKLIKRLLLHFAERRAQQEREKIADTATMRKHTWGDDRFIADDVTDPHLREKIRQELEQRRLKNLHGGNG